MWLLLRANGTMITNLNTSLHVSGKYTLGHSHRQKRQKVQNVLKCMWCCRVPYWRLWSNVQLLLMFDCHNPAMHDKFVFGEYLLSTFSHLLFKIVMLLRAACIVLRWMATHLLVLASLLVDCAFCLMFHSPQLVSDRVVRQDVKAELGQSVGRRKCQ